jgi:hypothetical protein
MRLPVEDSRTSRKDPYLDTRLNARLAEIGAQIRSEPGLVLDRWILIVPFTPFISRFLPGSGWGGKTGNFRGMVRLGVSTETILCEVRQPGQPDLITEGSPLSPLFRAQRGAGIKLASIIISSYKKAGEWS